jgi:Fur family ferric uptake transcriptional regulator
MICSGGVPVNELDNNMRLTNQRQVIIEELKKVTSHPTANEVFDMVRKRLPRIGLGTVYRNLDLLSDRGIIKKLEVYHIRCINCNRVDDIFIERHKDLEKSAASCCNFKILDHHVQFSGICSKCLPEA